MTCKRIEEAAILYCFKVIYEHGKEIFFIDTSMEDAARSANEFGNVLSILYLGEGMIGD